MNAHPGETTLNDYVDGELAPVAEADVLRHLDDCTACRREVERLQAVLAAAAGLESSIEPSRDLWTGIAGRIDANRSVDLEAYRAPRRGGLWQYRWQLTAAAAALVILASTGTLLLVGGEAERRGVMALPATQPPAATLVSVPGQADYARAIQELAALLASRSDDMDPQTVEVVERNMAIIDQAIRDAQRALAADPANGDLNRAVSAAYKTKINLLRRAVELPART